MNDSDQLLLSRYVDDDLSPLERKRAEALLKADPDARGLARAYGQISDDVGDLPRETLDFDIAPRVREALQRRTWASAAKSAKSPAILGALAASVLFCSLSLGIFLAVRDTTAPGLATDISRSPASSPIADFAPSTAETETSLSKTSAKPVPVPVAEPSSAAQPTLQTTIAGTVLPQSELFSRAMKESQSPAPAARTAVAVRAVPADRFGEFLERTGQIDRRHAFRLQVTAVSARLQESVLSSITRFRDPQTAVLSTVEPSDSKDASAGMTYVALVPTKNVPELQNALRQIAGGKLEVDLPPDSFRSEDEIRSRMKVVEEKDLAASAARFEPPALKTAETPPLEHRGPSDEPVRDAISQLLDPSIFAASANGSLDEVVIRIRTEPHRIDPDRNESTRPDRRKR
jgi:anti-sigma factor RsiW